MEHPEGLVTISVDDGHPNDLRVAEMLSRSKLKATFYVPRSGEGRAILPETEIRALGTGFEIGSHTLNHVPLTQVDDGEAWEEIASGKRWLEDVTGGAMASFCYPRGKVSRRIAALVRRAGFRGARTCMLNLRSWPRDPFYWGASSQAHSHSPVVQIRHAIAEANLTGAVNFALVHRFRRDWVAHFERSLDWVDTHGGVAHLFLHSWEIDDQGDWGRLDRALRSAAERSRLKPVTNGELFEMWWERQQLDHGITRVEPPR
jgi:peptidoglycan/xylan/chitin deacetylase (PgdA/CDA1 family)